MNESTEKPLPVFIEYETLLAGNSSRHLASEAYIRIELIRTRKGKKELFSNYIRDLLIIAVEDEVNVVTETKTYSLKKFDQLLLPNSTPFRVEPNRSDETFVQFVWTCHFHEL